MRADVTSMSQLGHFCTRTSHAEMNRTVRRDVDIFKRYFHDVKFAKEREQNV